MMNNPVFYLHYQMLRKIKRIWNPEGFRGKGNPVFLAVFIFPVQADY